MRILVVTQYFWPESFRINDLVEELVNRGHDVIILTGKPNYPGGKVFLDFKKCPESFNDYKGAQIIRVPMFARGNGKISLLMNYFSYSLAASVLGLWKLRKKEFDVVFICQLSPIFLALPGVLYKKIYRTPIAMWVLDLWPDSLESVGVVKSKFILSTVGKFVRFIYKHCDLILGQSKAFYNGISKSCDDKNKIKYFPSWSEPVFLNSNGRTDNTLMETDAFKVLFAGNVGEAQDFPAIISAAEEVKLQGKNIKIFVVGDGRAFESIRKEVSSRGLSDFVVLLGRFPLEKMPIFYDAADALLVSLRESQAFAMTIPGKVQSYMVAGKPILTMLSGEGSRVVDEAQCGLTAKSGDYKALAMNMIKLSEYPKELRYELGQNAKAYSKKEFNRDTLITQLEAWFEEISTVTKREKI
jgi:colanic acid biosynthesis glycosyl transferase WcaI